MAAASDDSTLAQALLELGCVLDGLRAAASRDIGLTPQQAQLLTLVDARHVTHSELAARMHCDKANITGLVDRLERRGLVQRRTNPDDRRVSQVSLTDRGTDLVTTFKRAVRETVADHLSSWPAADRRRLGALARAATEALCE
ncbi:MarR family winged helix-turn-helix transcriptional regulator [Nocardia sp. NPDC004068]|uniref:MarR family winged helix-turn-helix transcriptional regulator n=1 Tax=Nocardia sp. NPDC004068 TaxID=3364303 RepID=UPI0036C28DEE